MAQSNTDRLNNPLRKRVLAKVDKLSDDQCREVLEKLDKPPTPHSSSREPSKPHQ